MRVAISTRIFAPEPSAASFRLEALANAFADAGCEVEVLTVKPSRAHFGHLATAGSGTGSIRVKRFPVLRDKTGYVRGYLQYLSFDVPLFFRVLFGRRRDLIVTEPPPTTGFFVRLATALRRTPYAYYAADIWSDASESTGAPGIVVRVVRAMERFAMQGATGVLAVNRGVAARATEIAPRSRVHTVGNGIDVSLFTAQGTVSHQRPYFVYAGTASEWQGAGIFIEAFSQIHEEHPDCHLVFLGQGSDWPALQQLATGLPDGSVEFVPTVPPVEAADWLRGAVASIASIRPDSGYTFAFPTKVFASWGAGTPVLFAGTGPVNEFMASHSSEAPLGVHCEYDVNLVVSAMRQLLDARPSSEDRAALGQWAADNVGLQAVARTSVRALSGTLSGTLNGTEEEQVS